MLEKLLCQVQLQAVSVCKQTPVPLLNHTGVHMESVLASVTVHLRFSVNDAFLHLPFH